MAALASGLVAAPSVLPRCALPFLPCCLPGFGLSQRDMQVPGPPRWGAYGAPADQRYQQYGGMQAAGVMPQGQMRWRASGQMPQGPGGMRSGGMQHFNPAPGPPPGKVRVAAAGCAAAGEVVSMKAMVVAGQPCCRLLQRDCAHSACFTAALLAGRARQHAQWHARRRHGGHA